jgi:hypothetical protein
MVLPRKLPGLFVHGPLALGQVGRASSLAAPAKLAAGAPLVAAAPELPPDALGDAALGPHAEIDNIVTANSLRTVHNIWRC